MKQPYIERKFFFCTYARIILQDELLKCLIREKAHSYIVGVSHTAMSFERPVSVRKKKTLNIHLAKPMDDVFRGFNDTARNEIRRAERMSELRFTVNDNNWSDVYALYKTHRKARGLPLHPLSFLQNCLLFNAYWNEKLVSTVTCYDAYPFLRIQNIFSRIEHERADPRESRRVAGFAARRLVYEICKYGNAKGYQLLDMASVNLTDPAKKGITAFKSSFGGEVADEFTYTYKGFIPRMVGGMRRFLSL